MKKNIYLLLFLLIFVFSFFINANSSSAVFEYKNSTGEVTNVCNFPDILSCNSKLKEVCGSNTTAYCIQSTNEQLCYLASAVEPICPQVQQIDPDNNEEGGSDVYTLLAPIGEFKVAPDNIGEYFNVIFLIAIGLCGVLAVIMIVIGGIQYMGDESVFGKTQAKERITKAILGLIIALGAFALLNTINPELLGGGGLNIKQVSADIEEEDFPLTSNDSFTSGQKTQTCPEGIVFANTINGKIPICLKLKTKVELLISDANKAGLKIFGYGYRSKQKQEALRAQNCGGASNIYNPKAKCQPLTALPGRSRHENGLAIDFTCDGSTIRSRDNKCFVWLQKNGLSYGFQNLQKEPWHWSTDGK